MEHSDLSKVAVYVVIIHMSRSSSKNNRFDIRLMSVDASNLKRCFVFSVLMTTSYAKVNSTTV